MAISLQTFEDRYACMLRSFVCCVVLFDAAFATAQKTSSAIPACRAEIVEGEVRYGQLFERPIGNGLKLALEPLPSGWILRVLPLDGPQNLHDYAELATPPYRSVSPLLIGTDFSFRSQDALAWNPRRFHFATDRTAFRELERWYNQEEDTASSPQTQRVAESRLAALAAKSPEGELTLVDAHIVQGTADQAGTAALVATHLNSSAHEVDQPPGKATALGRLNWIRFRIRLMLPKGFQPFAGTRIEHGKCI